MSLDRTTIGDSSLAKSGGEGTALSAGAWGDMSAFSAAAQGAGQGAAQGAEAAMLGGKGDVGVDFKGPDAADSKPVDPPTMPTETTASAGNMTPTAG